MGMIERYSKFTLTIDIVTYISSICMPLFYDRYPASTSRFGLVFYADKANIVFNLNTYLNDTQEMIDTIRNVR